MNWFGFVQLCIRSRISARGLNARATASADRLKKPHVCTRERAGVGY